MKGEKGRCDTKGVKVRRWTSGLLCPSHPLTAALLLLADVGGASAHVVIVKTEKTWPKSFQIYFSYSLHSKFSLYLVCISVCVCVCACMRAYVYQYVWVCMFSMLQSENQNMHFAGKVRTFLREWGHRGRSNSSCSLGNSCCCHGYMWRATSEEERCGNSGGTVWIQPAAEDLWSHEWKTMMSQRRR